MNTGANDKLLREKINALDPLSGGVVFGKEEAWEKLQVRMEQKPSEKIPLRYWAAAAVLFLIVGATVVYYYPSKELPLVDNKAHSTVNTPTVAQPQVTLTQAKPENIPEHKILITAINRKPMAKMPINKKAPEQIKAVDAQPATIVKPEQKPVAVNIPAPVPPATKPMKVYYISDLERNDVPQQAQPSLAASPGVDLSKLKTLNINEVERQDVEFKQLLRLDNKLTLGQRFFFRPVLNYNTTQPEEDHITPRNPIKSIFNIQN